jgi:hypothetical protein
LIAIGFVGLLSNAIGTTVSQNAGVASVEWGLIAVRVQKSHGVAKQLIAALDCVAFVVFR